MHSSCLSLGTCIILNKYFMKFSKLPEFFTLKWIENKNYVILITLNWNDDVSLQRKTEVRDKNVCWATAFCISSWKSHQYALRCLSQTNSRCPEQWPLPNSFQWLALEISQISSRYWSYIFSILLSAPYLYF